MKTFLTTIITCLVSMSFAQNNSLYNLEVVSPQNHSDETVLRLHENACSYFNPQWDAWKIFTWNDQVPSIYSETLDGGKLSINSINFQQKDTVMPLILRIPEVSGTYTLNISENNTNPSNCKLRLKDLETGMIYPFDNGVSFNFDIMADSLQDNFRFEIFISEKAYLMQSDSTVTFHNDGCFDWSLDVYGENNQLVYSSAVNLEHTTATFSPGQYTSYISDNYGVIDTLTFFIEGDENNENENEEDNEGSFASIDNNTMEFLSREGGINYLVIPANSEIKKFSIHGINGVLFCAEDVSPEGIKYRLMPVGGIAIISLYSDNQKIVSKINY